MFKIGDFSRLTRVTVKALRHYDRLGLLKPDHIDGTSGYRYYTAAQLPRLERLLALKDLGFSLEQVGRLLDADLSAAQLRQLMHQKGAEVRATIAAEQERLARIEARVRQLDATERAARYPVTLRPSTGWSAR
jgi:DNA-binding transcriptional MerR regulator